MVSSEDSYTGFVRIKRPGVTIVWTAERTRTVELCSAWVEQRHILVGLFGGSDLSRQALVQFMVRCEEKQAVASFCQAVMLAKEAAASARQWPSRPSRRDIDPGFRPP